MACAVETPIATQHHPEVLHGLFELAEFALQGPEAGLDA